MSDADNIDPGIAETDRRRSPLMRHIPLWIGFLLIVVVGVVTVLIPEMSDDGDEDGAPTTESESESDDPAPSTPTPPSGSAVPAPAAP